MVLNEGEGKINSNDLIVSVATKIIFDNIHML